MTRTKLDTPAFADQSVDSRNIADGTIQAQDITGLVTGTQLAGSIANDKLVNNKFTIQGKEVSLGGSISAGVLVDWQAVTVADGSTTLTAEAGKGYFLDTNTGVIEVFLPSSPNRGDVIILADYSGTFATNRAIINTGGQLIDSTSGPDFKLTTNNTIAELVYVDSNKGWLILLNQAAGTTPTKTGNEVGGGYDTSTFIEATGGTILTTSTHKTHVFTGDGTFSVSAVGNSTPASPAPSKNTVDYVVIAGGAGGGAQQGGGGGAGGLRLSNSLSLPSPTTSPLANSSGITVTATNFPITVGGGGSGAPATTPTPRSTAGSNSVFSTITSAGGGAAGGGNNCGSPLRTGSAGGSGGGASWGDDAYNPPSLGTAAGGGGNTPPVSPPQGNAGGASGIGCNAYGGGGGGAGSVGGTPAASTSAGGDGSYLADTFFGPTAPSYGTPGPVSSTRYFSGGGAGRSRPGAAATELGGFGGGGDYTHPGSPGDNAAAGVANSGGGGGSVYPGTGGTGGKGIVLIRYKIA